MQEKVILVNKNDKEIGNGEKIKTHLEGKLHRALSIFIINSKGELLLQQRAKKKYHSGGLWSNTCCSHPRPGEATKEAAHSALKREMGFDCQLNEIFSFVYKVKLDNNLFEHEYDHVFLGKFDGDFLPNPEEVEDWKWIDAKELKKSIKRSPDNFTFWFKLSIDKAIPYLKTNGF